MLGRGMIGALLIAVAAPPAAAQDKTPPYWASIASGEAMMRTGPGKNYPGIWLYKRRDLPVRVLQLYPSWRLIQDPDGTRGWMLVTLLSDRRTGIVKQGGPRPIRVRPEADASVRYIAEPGVVGRIENCRDGWCQITIDKREGFIRSADIWGVGDGEVVD
ncbi:MAG: SH3 domain-containing protein [Pseudomonadota bacterium]|nr:SH3 domain-containing protein [Pseudomonadota bacterium]